MLNEVAKLYSTLFFFVFLRCSKNDTKRQPPSAVNKFKYLSFSINGISNNSFAYTNVPAIPIIKISFSEPVKRSAATGNILLNERTGMAVNFLIDYENKDGSLLLQPTSSLKSLHEMILNKK